MRVRPKDRAERGRVLFGRFASTTADGCNGLFVFRPCKAELHVIASNGEGWPFGGERWEHVSVSHQQRCPTWNEMAAVKDCFWGPTETVIQLHVPESEHINDHPYCLHLWRPMQTRIPLPPRGAV